MLPSNPSTDSADDRGSAALEFILVGMLLLVPLVYLIVSLGLIQGQSLGAEAGARHIARALSTAESPDAARQSATDMDFPGFLATLDANVLGPLRVTQALLPNLRAAGNDATSSPDSVARWMWERIGK